MSTNDADVLMAIEKVVRLLKGLEGALSRLAEAIEQKESVKQ